MPRIPSHKMSMEIFHTRIKNISMSDWLLSIKLRLKITFSDNISKSVENFENLIIVSLIEQLVFVLYLIIFLFSWMEVNSSTFMPWDID